MLKGAKRRGGRVAGPTRLRKQQNTLKLCPPVREWPLGRFLGLYASSKQSLFFLTRRVALRIYEFACNSTALVSRSAISNLFPVSPKIQRKVISSKPPMLVYVSTSRVSFRPSKAAYCDWGIHGFSGFASSYSEMRSVEFRRLTSGSHVF